MKLKKDQRVDYETAKERALRCLHDYGSPVNASWVGQSIWPDNNMRAQGLGAAASRILVRMKKEGLVRWTSQRTLSAERWGYVLTSNGHSEYLKGVNQ